MPGSRNLESMQLWPPVKGLIGYRKRRCLAQGNRNNLQQASEVSLPWWRNRSCGGGGAEMVLEEVIGHFRIKHLEEIDMKEKAGAGQMAQ